MVTKGGARTIERAVVKAHPEMYSQVALVKEFNLLSLALEAPGIESGAGGARCMSPRSGRLATELSTGHSGRIC